MRLTQIIEALLFASDAPLTAADLARVDERLDEDTVSAVVDELRSDYDVTERSFQIYDVAGGYQILTRPEFVALLERYDTVPQSARLSTPALEVLAIIAYRQPLGRSEVEEIRGVQSAAVLRTLQDRGLIEPVGRAEALGRPLLYGTTSRFLDHFGFRSLEDLPRPDELPVVLRTRHVAEDVAADAVAETAEAPAAPETDAPEAAAAPETESAPPDQDANRPEALTEVEAAAETGEEPLRTAAAAEEIVADTDTAPLTDEESHDAATPTDQDPAAAGTDRPDAADGSEHVASDQEGEADADEADVEPASVREG